MLARVFRKNRVHLNGLGSTLVWVDRPFSWRRLWEKLWPPCTATVAVVVYILLADALPPVPGASRIQNWLDENDLSVFRAVSDPATVGKTASETRHVIAEAIHKAQLSNDRIASEFFGTEASTQIPLSADLLLQIEKHLDGLTGRTAENA